MSVDPAWKGLYKVGGLSSVISAVLFIIGTLAFFALGPIPTTGEQALKWASQKPLFGILNIIDILADILVIPVGLAFYLALKHVRMTEMLVATALWEASVILQLVLDIVRVSLESLSERYLAATTEAQRAAYTAAADLNLGILLGGLAAAYFPALVSTLIISWIMLKGVFGKRIAYLGIVGSILGLIGLIPIPVLFILFLIFLVLIITWLILAGYKLYKLGS